MDDFNLEEQFSDITADLVKTKEKYFLPNLFASSIGNWQLVSDHLEEGGKPFSLEQFDSRILEETYVTLLEHPFDSEFWYVSFFWEEERLQSYAIINKEAIKKYIY